MSEEEIGDEMFTVEVDGAIYFVRWDDSSQSDMFTRYIITGNDLHFTIQLRVFNDLNSHWIVVSGDDVENELADQIGTAIEERDL